ncbi:DUF7520 family protein [Natronocalculus amylovorans]|uniref:Cox cluster protein n=1 Tax=Natronocalculus amylovorans TaxID=2917812 RepID=A0AAE3K6W1_9EURY|nr:cox cluster protein [Natronocalculus amylovorans]MCL9815398.1 cox cluster protein [Natronocalculus amylovorans]NUE02087.1 cox cluster protein [Halorubraceae archaeon YAN]
MSERSLSGPRLIIIIYLGVVAFAGLTGFLLPRIVSDVTEPRLFFLIELPATSVGLAVYGAVTIAVVLGVLLWLVTYVSEHIDDAEPGQNR